MGQVLALQTGAYFESPISCSMSHPVSCGEASMSAFSDSSSGASAPPQRPGRVVAVRIAGKLPTSSAPTDEDERLTVAGIGATRSIMKDIASARPGSAVERSGLQLIDGIWQAHANASDQRKAAADAFRAFAAGLRGAETSLRLPSILPVRSTPAAAVEPLAGAVQEAPTVLRAPFASAGGAPDHAPADASPAAAPAADQPIASDDDSMQGTVHALPGSVAKSPETALPAPIASSALPGSDQGIYEPSKALVERWQAARDLDLRLTADSLFSTCVESYVARRWANNPDVHLSSITYPARLFVALIGDRPMRDYDSFDLQRFVDRAKHVPPRFETRWPNETVAGIAARNWRFELGAPSRKTMKDCWVAPLRSIFAHHAKKARAKSQFAGETLELPRVLRPPRKHPAPPIAVTNEAFRLGAQSASIVDALMPLLAFATGRRIGLLAYLQGSSFLIDRRTGVVYAKVAQTIQTPQGLQLTPYKTVESTGEFVIPRYVVETGLVAWAMSKGDGFLFEDAHAAQDPADMVSKRIASLLEEAQARTGDSERGTAHGWRGQAEDRFDEHEVPDGASKIQVGHALTDVHSKYKSGRLPTPDAKKLFSAPPDEGIDLSPFDGLEFSRFDRES
jgi:integrase